MLAITIMAIVWSLSKNNYKLHKIWQSFEYNLLSKSHILY